MGKVLPSQRLLKQFEEQLVFGEMNLSEIVRSGAQMMLQYALEREVTEALGRNYYENAPATTKEKGRRNGYESHRVLTGEGVEILFETLFRTLSRIDGTTDFRHL